MRELSTIFLMAVWICNTAPAYAEPDPWAAARPAIARGEALFEAQNYGAAMAEFSAAYDQLAGYSRRYSVLSNIAACHERLFHYDLAIAFYQRYLDEGGESIEDRAEVEARIHTLDQLLATLTLVSNVPADVWIDDRIAGRAPGVIRVSPGRHLIELRAPLRESKRRDVNLAAGSAGRLVFELEELSQYSGLGPGYFWTFAGLTVVAVGIGASFGIAALDADADGAARALQNRFLNTEQDEDAVKRTARVADIAFIGAAVLGASATVLFFLTDWHDERVLEPYATGDGRAWQLGVRGAL